MCDGRDCVYVTERNLCVTIKNTFLLSHHVAATGPRCTEDLPPSVEGDTPMEASYRG